MCLTLSMLFARLFVCLPCLVVRLTIIMSNDNDNSTPLASSLRLSFTFLFAFPFSPPICIRSSLFSHLSSRICKKHFVRWLWLKNKHRIVWICVGLWWNGSFTKNYFTECQPSKSAMEYNWFNFNHIVMHETYHANDEWLFSIAENCKEEPRIDVVRIFAKVEKVLELHCSLTSLLSPTSPHSFLFLRLLRFFYFFFCVCIFREKKTLNIVMIYIFKPILSHYRIRPIANFSFADPSIFFFWYVLA